MLFKYSKKDILLVIVCLLNVSGFLLAANYYHGLSSVMKVILGVAFVCFYCTNYQCVSHNFIHNNFFTSDKLNFVFSLINSMAMGLPQTLYYQHHMNHHRYNNDKPAKGNETKDISSLYRYGKDGKEEGLLTYSFIGFFRIDLVSLAKRNKGDKRRLFYVELISVLIFWCVLIDINYKFFLMFYLPVWYLGQVAALMENYFEHYGAGVNDRKRDSVSCYNKLYNFLWFNNGYHQEHHFSPTTHWTEIEKVKDLLPKDRKIVDGAHFFNFPRS